MMNLPNITSLRQQVNRKNSSRKVSITKVQPVLGLEEMKNLSNVFRFEPLLRNKVHTPMNCSIEYALAARPCRWCSWHLAKRLSHDKTRPRRVETTVPGLQSHHVWRFEGSDCRSEVHFGQRKESATRKAARYSPLTSTEYDQNRQWLLLLRVPMPTNGRKWWEHLRWITPAYRLNCRG